MSERGASERSLYQIRIPQPPRRRRGSRWLPTPSGPPRLPSSHGWGRVRYPLVSCTRNCAIDHDTGATQVHPSMSAITIPQCALLDELKELNKPYNDTCAVVTGLSRAGLQERRPVCIIMRCRPRREHPVLPQPGRTRIVTAQGAPPRRFPWSWPMQAWAVRQDRHLGRRTSSQKAAVRSLRLPAAEPAVRGSANPLPQPGEGNDCANGGTENNQRYTDGPHHNDFSRPSTGAARVRPLPDRHCAMVACS